MPRNLPAIRLDPRVPAYIEDHAVELVRRMVRALAGERDWTLSLTLGAAQDFPMDRDFAYCRLVEPHHAEIVVAPRMVAAVETREGRDRVSALLRHELAHAVLLICDLPHSERDADRMARDLFGLPIFYDRDDVQTINPNAPGARKPRPAYLPA